MATDQRDSSRAEWRAAVSRPLDAPVFHPVSASIGLEVAGVSVPGKTQVHNTDHFVAIRLGRMQETLTSSLAEADLPQRFEEYGYAMLVADGLDSDGTGGRASRFALSTLAHLAIRYGKWNVRVGPDTASDFAAQSEFFYRQLTDAVIQASRTDASLAGMATSLTALYVAGADLFFAHVGHSRAYLFRNGVLIQLTMDHTLERLISASAALRRVRLEARRPPGTEPSVADVPRAVPDAIGSRGSGTEIGIEHVQLWPADRLLLCTNGLTDYVREDQIADVLSGQRRPADDAQRLVDLALANGATDSVTVLLGDYWMRALQEAPEAPP
jgi:serine/threonine protein phosphatase PrpC